MPELDAMLRMLYASQDADPELLALLGVNGTGDEDALTFDEFLVVSKWRFFARWYLFATPCSWGRIMVCSRLPTVIADNRLPPATPIFPCLQLVLQPRNVIFSRTSSGRQL